MFQKVYVKCNGDFKYVDDLAYKLNLTYLKLCLVLYRMTTFFLMLYHILNGYTLNKFRHLWFLEKSIFLRNSVNSKKNQKIKIYIIYYIQLCLNLCNNPLFPACPWEKPGQAATWTGKAGKLNTKPVLSRVAKI